MSAEETPVTEDKPKKRGPRKESEIRAEVEAEMREKIEAEARDRIEAEARERIEAELRAEFEAKAQAEARERELASEARPITGFDVTGDPSDANALTVHFVDDGLTLLGKVWFRGEELTINPGTENWDAAHSILTMDEYAQEERWGRRFFREGPWRGKRLDEIEWDELTDDEREQLKKAQRLREEKYGSVTT